MQAIVQESTNFSTDDQSLRASRARAISHVLHRHRVRVWWLGMGGQSYPDGIILNWPGDRHSSHSLSHFENFALSENSVNLRLFNLCCSIENRMKAVDRWIVDFQL